jgi:hypothetical protein
MNDYRVKPPSIRYGLGGGAAHRTPARKPDLLTRLEALGLDGSRWRQHPDLWPCVEACQQWAEAAKVTDGNLLEAHADLLLSRTEAIARRYLRACAAYLREGGAR